MTNRIPLIVDAGSGQIEELPVNDNLDLSGSNVVNAINITATGDVTANSFIGDGSQLTNLPAGNYSNSNVQAYLNDFNGNITPSANVTYGLGNATNQWKDLWLSGNTLYMGGSAVGLANGALQVDGANVLIQATGNTPTTVIGNFEATGNIEANVFIGDGSQLTNLPVQPGTYTDSNVTTLLSTGITSNVITTGNVSGGFFIGDGSLLTNLPVQPDAYGNANVESLLSTGITSNVITTGNVSGGYVLGDGSQLTNLPVQPGTYTNSNVTTLLSTGITSNVITTGNSTAGYFVGDGSLLTNLPVQPGTYGNANVETLLSTGITSNVITTANISGAYVLGNGTFLTGVVQPDDKPNNLLYVAKNGNDSTGTGSSNAPYLTVQAAIDAAATAAAATTIILAPGSYTETLTINNAPAALNITGSGLSESTINGSITISGTSNNIEIDNLRVGTGTLTHSATGYLSIINSRFAANTGFTKTGAGVAKLFNVDLGAVGTGSLLLQAGKTLISNSQIFNPQVSGASTEVNFLQCDTVILPTVVSGNVNFIDSVIVSSGTGSSLNAIGGYVTLKNCLSITPTRALAPITFGAGSSYSYGDSGFDYANTSFAGTAVVQASQSQGINTRGNIAVSGQIQSTAFSGGNISWSVANQTDFQNTIRINGAGTIKGPGGAVGITLNNNGANTSVLGATSAAAATSTTTGAIQVVGGIGVGGNVYSGGNVTGNYLLGNVAFATGFPAAGNYGDSNVEALLSTGITSNVITTANISGGYVLGNGAFLTGLPASYGNANVVTLLEDGSLTSNVVTTTTISSGKELVGDAASANFTRFPNALAVISTTASGIQVNELGATGLVAEATGNPADLTHRGVGAYGVGYTSGAASADGISGEAHVSDTADTGTAVGVRGYADDTHAGGINIGLYSSAIGGATNYALYMKHGDIFSFDPQTWTLADNSTNALNVSSTGKSGILNVDTTDGAEAVTMSGDLTVVGNISAPTAANGTSTTQVATTEFVNYAVNIAGVYTDANVETLLASGAVTSNIITGGNVAGTYFIGDGSALTNVQGNYSDSNVVSLLGGSTLTTDIITTGALESTSLTTTGDIDVGADVNAAGLNTTGTDQLFLAGNAISSSSNMIIDPLNDGSGLTGNVSILGNLSVSGNINVTNIDVSTTANLLWVAAETANTPLGASGGGLAVGNATTPYATLTYSSVANTWNSNLPITASQFNGNVIGSNVVAGNINALTTLLVGTQTSPGVYTPGFITMPGTGSNITVAGNIQGSYILGNGAFLTGITASATGLQNGTSNVVIATPNSDINFNVNGIAAGYIAGNGSVVLGTNAGTGTTGANVVSIGYNAGGNSQGASAVAIGPFAGNATQGGQAVAVGFNAGLSGQSAYGVAIGTQAGQTSQGVQSVAIGYVAGLTSQGTTAVAVGTSAGKTSQGASAVAIGNAAGITNQGIGAVAIGSLAGNASQGGYGVAIGYGTGNAQAAYSVAIGYTAGATNQGGSGVAVGQGAGGTTQGSQATAVGSQAGATSQGTQATAYGAYAGQNTQGAYAVAVGYGAGQTSQGGYSVAVGYGAGGSSQANNTIILNATGSALSGVSGQTNSFYVGQVRQDNGNSVTQLNYNNVTKEITYGNAPPTFQAVTTLNDTVTLTNATNTLIPLGTENWDTNACFNATNATVTLNGISAPAYSFAPNRAGYYQVNGYFSFSSMPANSGIVLINVYKNGSAYKRGVRVPCNTVGIGVTVNTMVYMNGTSDYIQLYGSQSSGSNATLETNGADFSPTFSAVWVRGA